MTHYILEDGLFREAYERMDKTLLLPFKRFETPKKAAKKSKTKYTCPCCGTSVWGKEELVIKCFTEDCEEEMEAQD